MHDLYKNTIKTQDTKDKSAVLGFVLIELTRKLLRSRKSPSNLSNHLHIVKLQRLLGNFKTTVNQFLKSKI